LTYDEVTKSFKTANQKFILPHQVQWTQTPQHTKTKHTMRPPTFHKMAKLTTA